MSERIKKYFIPKKINEDRISDELTILSVTEKKLVSEISFLFPF